MCLSVGVMLTACGDEEHTHTYKTEWSKDTTHHWHACEGEDCTDVADKAEHTWNEGEITTEATAEADGVKTFICTVCGQAKTEPVEYTVNATVTKDEWENAFDELIRGSFAITLDGRHPETTDNRNTWLTTHIVTPTTQKMGGVINGTEGLYYVIVENNVIYNCYYNAESDSWDKVEVSEYSQENWFATYNGASKESGNLIIDEIFYPYHLTYDSFSYDEKTDRYLCEEILLSDGLNNDKYTDIVVSFANGKIQKISCTFFDISSDNVVTAKFTITVSCAEEDIVITLPDFNVGASKVTVTEEEWNAALAKSNFTITGFVTERDKQESLTMKITDSLIYTENDGIERYYAKKDDGWHITNGIAFGAVMNGMSASVEFAMMSFRMPGYTSFNYDEEAGAYVYVKADSASGFYKFSVYFDDGVIVKIEGEEDSEGGVTHSFNFENYGTTVVEIPTVTE